jgi:hypothetical protein
VQATVPIQRLAALHAEIAQINGHYARFGAEPVRLIDTGGRTGSCAVVRLEGEVAQLGDWSIVCVLEHEAGRTVVRACAPMSEEHRDRLTAARGLCEACRTVRPRSKTYLLRNRTTGRTVQLGSSCVRPFTAAGSSQAAIRRAEQLATARTALSAAARRTPAPGERYIDTLAFLAHAIAAVRDGEYAPASHPAPTWSTALERLQEDAPASSGDLERASDVRHWAETRRTEDAGSYRSRRADCLAHDRLCSRELALAASAIPAYNRHLYWLIRQRHRRARQAAKGPS